MHFADSAIFVPYGCMVDEFQHRVYANPELTPAERKAIWKQLEKEYRPEMDYEDDPFFAEGGYWQRQGHIFNSPFYYIDYVLASICAMQFKAAMDEDYEDAWNRYLMLSRSSASDYFTGTIAKAGLENPFEDGTISRLVAQLSKKVD
jgi:oligoendopeptidase F